MPVRTHAPECAKTLALVDPLPAREAAKCTCGADYERGALSATDAAALRAEVERLRSELVLAIDEAEHGHRCSFCGGDLTGGEPCPYSKDCKVSSLRDALTREGAAR